MREDCYHRPDKCAKDKKNIYWGQEIILQTKLNRGKSKIKNKIKQEG